MKVIGKDSIYTVEKNNESSLMLNGSPVSLDVVTTSKNTYHVLYNNVSYDVFVANADHTTKTFTLSINGNLYTLKGKDSFDELLDQLGMSSIASVKTDNITAPMPGLVLDILVEVGNAVKKGEPIVVLEAMKMENSLKSPSDGVIKSIDIKKGQAVEKSQVLISFE